MVLAVGQRAGEGHTKPDAVVVGSGPNGPAAALRLAAAGLRVQVFERNEQVGGGLRSAELTSPGYVHDVCSAVHPMAAPSPFFREFDLAARGVRLLHPEVPYDTAAVPTAVLPEAAWTTTGVLLGVLSAVLAVGLAALALWAPRLPGLLRRAERPFSPVLDGLRRVHSGHVGDYVAWLFFGIAALGALVGAPLL